jgi:hypothetical protein
MMKTNDPYQARSGKLSVVTQQNNHAIKLLQNLQNQPALCCHEAMVVLGQALKKLNEVTYQPPDSYDTTGERLPCSHDDRNILPTNSLPSSLKVVPIVLNYVPTKALSDLENIGDFSWYNCVFHIDRSSVNDMESSIDRDCPHNVAAVLLYNLAFLFHFMGMHHGMTNNKLHQALNFYQSCWSLFEPSRQALNLSNNHHVNSSISTPTARSLAMNSSHGSSIWMVLVAAANNMGHIYTCFADWASISGTRAMLRSVLETIGKMKNDNPIRRNDIDDHSEIERWFLWHFHSEFLSSSFHDKVFGPSHAPSA